jgi:hypothetical protein
MCDPFFMLILMEALGPDYVVWDKSAHIAFKKPGRSKVRATFQVPEAEIARIREQTRTQYKVEPEFSADIVDFEGNLIAQVKKVLHVRRKDAVKPPRQGNA